MQHADHFLGVTKMVPAAVFALSIAGCAAAPCIPQGPAPEVVRATVAIPTPCTPPAVARPSWAVDALPLGATLPEQQTALRAERLQRKAYEAELEAAVRACAEDAPK